MSKKYYIAYGSNLSMAQMATRCPDAIYVGIAEIEDYQLLFKGSQTGSYLTVEQKKGRKVPVLVWRISQRDEMNLDRYEGYPSFYYKKKLELPIRGIKSGKIRNRKCFVYIMHEERSIGIPSLSYVKVCLEGYISFGFDEHFLAEAQLKTEEARYGKNRDC